jgi:hypothetical protein
MKKQSATFLVLLILATSVPAKPMEHSASMGKPAAYFLGAVGLYCAARYWATPEQFQPTLTTTNVRTITPVTTTSHAISLHDYMQQMGNASCEQSQEVMLRKKSYVRATVGIDLSHVDQDRPVFVFSPSFLPIILKHPQKFLFFPPSAPGRSLYTAAHYLANKSLPTTSITFDYRDTRSSLNVAQELDQRCLKMVTDEIVRQKHGYVMFSVCRGSANLLAFLTQQPQETLQKDVKAVVMASAPFSLKSISQQTMRALPILNLIPHRIGTEMLYGFFRALFPNHRYQESSILERVHNIPQELPMLIIHVKGDSVVYDGDIQALLQKLLETGHTRVHVLLLDNKHLDHYTMSTAPVYPQAINAFLQTYDLPHDHELAQTRYEARDLVVQPLCCPSEKSIQQYIRDLWGRGAISPEGNLAT